MVDVELITEGARTDRRYALKLVVKKKRNKKEIEKEKD
jgi:hypothetical protein